MKLTQLLAQYLTHSRSSRNMGRQHSCVWHSWPLILAPLPISSLSSVIPHHPHLLVSHTPPSRCLRKFIRMTSSPWNIILSTGPVGLGKPKSTVRAWWRKEELLAPWFAQNIRHIVLNHYTLFSGCLPKNHAFWGQGPCPFSFFFFLF